MKLQKISIHDFIDYVPNIIIDLYDNSSICLYISSDGYFVSDNSKSDAWFVGWNESDVIDYFASLL